MAVEKHIDKIIASKSINTSKKKETASVKEMEAYFEIDKTEPIKVSANDEKDVKEKGDCFKDWYQSELRELYARKD